MSKSKSIPDSVSTRLRFLIGGRGGEVSGFGRNAIGGWSTVAEIVVVGRGRLGLGMSELDGSLRDDEDEGNEDAGS
jgi:hypothetical protein